MIRSNLRNTGLSAWLAILVTGATANAGVESSEPARSATAFAGLYTRAEVEGPRGRFVTEIVSLADGRARFVQSHPDRPAEILVTPEGAFERSPEGAFVGASPGTTGFVRTHDALRVLAAGGEANATLERLSVEVPADFGGGELTMTFADRRRVHGRILPFVVDFAHRGERYTYRYTAVLPLRLAPGVELPSDPAALFARLGDLGELAAAHERVLEAHRRSDADLLAAGGGEVATVSGRGELSESRRSDFLDRMRGYLGATRFTRYADTEVPVLAVSADGTLGWLACEIEAEGVRTSEGKDEPLAYGFSWVELYAHGGAKEDGRWISIGNASSQRPDNPD